MNAKTRTFLNLSLFLALATLASCGGGGTSTTSTTTTTPPPAVYGALSSPDILAGQFVTALNSVDRTSGSYVAQYDYETVRSAYPGQEKWFVIWDAKFGEFKAVSLSYIRTIIYYDFYVNNKGVASEFRSIEQDDILNGHTNGDVSGEDYEIVDYNSTTHYYLGRNSGFLYEDQAGTTDVSMMAQEQERMKFYEKAARVSFAYNVSIETSMSMVTLGAKIERMLSHGNGSITPEDQLALVSDLKSLTGVSLEEIKAAAQDSKAKADAIAKIADKIGTSAQNLEQKFLPEVFGINL